MRRSFSVAGLALLAMGLRLPAFASPPRSGGSATAGAHDVHLSYTRMVVDGSNVVARVRLFKDDAERALRVHAKRPELRLDAGAASDAVFADYFNAHVTVSADGERLRGKVLQSGLDADAGEAPMWWYLVELPARKPVRALTLRVALLFETYNDQRNVVTLLEMPGEKRHSLYFAGDSKDEMVTLGR